MIANGETRLVPDGQDQATWPFDARATLCLCVDVSEPPVGGEPVAVPEAWYERAGSDRLLRLFADTGITATFTWARPGPISFDLIGEVGEAGHEVAARLDDDRLPVESWADDLRQTRSTLVKRAGSEITGFRAVGDASRPELRQVGFELGFQWMIDQPYGDRPLALRPAPDAPTLVHLPTSRWFDDRRLWLDQTTPATTAYEIWRDDLESIRDEGGFLCLTLHPSVCGRPGPSRAIALLLDHAIDAGDVWIAPAGAVAAWWAEQHGAV